MKKGLILIIVLWILIILSLLSLTLSHSQHLDIRLCSFYLDEAKATWLIKGDLYTLISKLGADQTPYDTLEEIELLNATDEDGKINLNTASKEMLERLPHINSDIAEEIIKMRPLFLTEELLLIEGILEEMYYGSMFDPQPGLKDLVTTFGDGKININTAPCEVLIALGLSEAGAQAILEHRKYNPFLDNTQILNDLKGIGISLEEASNISQWTKVSSNIYNLNLKRHYNKVNKTIEVRLKRNSKYIEIILWREG
jgi:DNA uptake protein ComE-like DNA-binding protein